MTNIHEFHADLILQDCK